MNQVIVGFDDSPASGNAVRWAAVEAERRGVALRIVKSWRDPAFLVVDSGTALWDPHDFREEMRAALETHAQHVLASHPGVDYDTELIDGPAASGLTDRVGSDDLLVVGSRGSGGFLGLRLGSVSSRVARRSPAPVVVVHGSPTRRDQPTVVVGIDGSAASRRALVWAAEAANLFDKRLVVVSAWAHEHGAMHECEPVRPADSRGRTETMLSATIDEVLGPEPSVAVERRIEGGQPAEVLLDVASEASLLVVGRVGSSRWSSLDSAHSGRRRT